MARLDVDLKNNIDWRSTIAIGRYVRRANESFSRTAARRMALMIIKEFDSVGRIWHAVQASLDGRASTSTRGRGKNRIILEMVGASN